MRKVLLLLPAVLAVQACVYNSPVPLAAPDEAVFDEALLGEWRPVDDTSEVGTVPDTDATVIRVVRDSGGYLLSDLSEGEDRAASGYVVVLDDVRFLTIIEDHGDGPVYSFARYTVAGDRLSIRFIADRAYTEIGGMRRVGEARGITGAFATSAELQAAVRARLHDPLLYEEDEVLLVRQPAKPARR